MKIDIYKDGISYVTDEVSSVKVEEANLNEDNRINFVTELAAVSRGNSKSNNPPVRYKALLKEAAPQLDKNGDILEILNPSRPLEFLPVVIGVKISGSVVNVFDISSCEVIFSTEGDLPSISLLDILSLARHSHFEETTTSDTRTYYRCYTNMRALLNIGLPYEKIPYNDAVAMVNFKALKAMVPMFVWAHVPMTHTMISKETQSDRVSGNDEYWLPDDFRERVYDFVETLKYQLVADALNSQDKLLTEAKMHQYESLLKVNNKKSVVYLLLTSWSQATVQGMFKELKYKREIYSRAIYYFKYKEVVLTGWNNDPKVWEHLFLERNAVPETHKNWTQSQTETFVKAIKSIIKVGH